MTDTKTPAETRLCVRCGAALSRFNATETCARCGPAADPAASGDEWLGQRAAAALDDAGVALRGWRAAGGHSQADIASRLGMTQQNLSQIENGRHPMSHDLRRRVATELGIPPAALGLAPSRPRIGPDDLDAKVVAAQARWRTERRWLNQHRGELARLAVDLYPAEERVSGTPLICGPGWMPSGPMELRTLRLELDERPVPSDVDGSEPETLPVRPLSSAGLHFDRYTSAIKHLDPPQLFESRPSYRLLAARPVGVGSLDFGLAAYFDKLDVSEALGHETAAACLRRGGLPSGAEELGGALPFRSLVGDPYDPARRAIIPAVTTLTIRLRRHPAPPSFLLHWRDPAKVATAGGVYDVIPAGEFQPASVAIWDRRNDFDLWRNIVREYSEELLGAPEHDGTRSRPIDYESWSLFQRLESAQQHGALVPFFLGIGLDALTLAATILTVVVVDDDVFSRLFGAAVRYNDEGEIVALGDGRAAEGLPFTEETIERLLRAEPMAAPGAACLALAWRHRDHLLGL